MSATTRRSVTAAPQAGPSGVSHRERPPKQTGNNLNVILLASDIFRVDNLAAFGGQWVDCPILTGLCWPRPSGLHIRESSEFQELRYEANNLN